MNPRILRRRGKGISSGGVYTPVYLSTLALGNGASYTAMAGTNLIVDVDSARLDMLMFEAGSKYSFDETASRTVYANSIMGMPGSVMSLGEVAKVPQGVTLTHVLIGGPNGSEVNRPNHPVSGVPQGKTNDGISRGFMWYGALSLNGTRAAVTSTRLIGNAAIGDQSILVEGNVKTAPAGKAPWVAGGQIGITKGNLYSQSNNEQRTITAIDAYDAATNSTRVYFTGTALTEPHYGKIQYPVDSPYGTSGIQDTPLAGGQVFTPANAGTPTTYHARCRVFYLTAGNIVIKGEDDITYWRGQNFGGIFMRHPGSTYYGCGVRLENMGQKGILKGYPSHDHFLSYSSVRGAVTFNVLGALIKVHWPAHGISKQTVTGTITFLRNPYVGPGSGLIYATISGVPTTNVATGVACLFQAGSGSTLPTGVVANQIYFMSDASWDTGTPGTFYLATTPYYGSAGAGGAPMVPWTNNGSGTNNIIDLSTAAPYGQGNQPLMFQTTGTLPAGLTAGDVNFSTSQPTGTRFRALGVGLTADDFYVTTFDTLAPVASGAAGSGTHTALYVHHTGPTYSLAQMQDESFVTHSYQDGCVIVGTANRGFVCHGTTYSKRLDCFVWCGGGQGTGAVNFSGEDGSEHHNYFARDYVVSGRIPPVAADRLKDFDGPYDNADKIFIGSSGHWITNLNNWFIDMGGYDCEGFGVHNSGAQECFGNSSLVAINPAYSPTLRWLNNGGMGNSNRGLVTAFGINDEFGRINLARNDLSFFTSNATNEIGLPGNLFEGLWSYKNQQGGYLNTVYRDGPLYIGATTGDNLGVDWEGSMPNALLPSHSILMAGFSNLPAATTPIANDTAFTAYAPRGGNATYHATLIIAGCSYVNFPGGRSNWTRGGQQDNGPGAIMLRDTYTDEAFIQYKLMQGSTFSNAHPGHLTRDYRYSGYPVTISLANPCVVTVPLIGSSAGNEWEFDTIDDSPFRFVRTTGALPAAFALDVEYRIKSSSTVGAVRTFQLSATVGGASISTLGQSQSGNHSGVPMWRTYNTPWRTTYGTTMPDPEGQYVRAFTGVQPSVPQWVCPYGDNPFYTTGARNNVAVETSDGLFGLGFSTSDFFVGFGQYQTNQGGPDPGIGFVVTRKVPVTLANIGVIKNDSFPAGSNYFFQGFVHGAILGIRGSQTCYFFEPGSSPGAPYVAPTTFSALRFTDSQDASVDYLVAFRFASVPTAVYRTQAFNSPPAVRDPGVGMSVGCTAATGADNAAKIAAVAADATGSLYHYDSSAGYVFMRVLPLALNAGFTASLASRRDTDPDKTVDSQWCVIRG